MYSSTLVGLMKRVASFKACVHFWIVSRSVEFSTIRNPAVATTDSYDTGIERTLVIGDDVWTMSSSGLLVSDLGSLHRRGWVPFS